MANKKISDLTNMSGSASIDRAADFFEVSDTSGPTSYKATPNFILGITGSPLGTSDTQNVTNKTLDNTNTITAKDNLFTLQDGADTTKQAQFQLSGITASTTRTYTLPDVTDTIVTLTATQTLTNKTMTSPTLNTPTIVNPTLTVDTVSEFTGANGVTVDGMNIKDGKLNTNNSVVTANITNDAVTDDKLDYPRWYQEIARTTLGVAGDTITVSSIPARSYLAIVISIIATGGTIDSGLKFNNDSGANYSQAGSSNGAAYADSVSAANIPLEPGALAQNWHGIIYSTNFAAQEKIGYHKIVQSGGAGAAVAPDFRDAFNKWANTSAQINRVDVINTGTGDFAIGSEVIVLGHD